MILVFEVVFASIAAILSILTLRTQRAIRHLGVGNSFWIPVCVGGVIFIVGSVITIFYELDLSLPDQAASVVQVSRILALSVLTLGIYSYSRKVTGGLREEVTVPEQLVEEQLISKPSIVYSPSSETLFSEKKTEKKGIEKGSKKEKIPVCKHRLGYLHTLPKTASIPDECFGCVRIIECKHSLAGKLESQAQTA